MTQEEKAKAYDEAIERAKNFIENGDERERTIAESIFAGIMEESEDERIRQFLIHEVTETSDKIMSYRNMSKKDVLAWLEKQREQKSIDEIAKDVSKDKTSAVAFLKAAGIMNENGELAEQYRQGEQKHAEWHREDEQNLNACLGYIRDEFLRRWLTDIIHVKYDKPAELPKGEDYGIDGLYAAIDILQKTLGEVDGYQSDDGILAHKCAISAVKELSEQEWSEEDEWKFADILALLRGGENCHYNTPDLFMWLKSLKDRYTWKPSDEQIYSLDRALRFYGKGTAVYDSVKELLEQLKTL